MDGVDAVAADLLQHLVQLPAIVTEGGEHQPGGRAVQRQHRADLGHQGDHAARRFHLHHGRPVAAPYRQEAGLLQRVAQFGEVRRGDLHHVQPADRRQADVQRLAPQAIVVGRRVLLGEAAGEQRLQVAVDLRRRHAQVFGQPLQRGARRQGGEALENLGADFRRLHLVAPPGGGFFLLVRRFRLFPCHRPLP
ncbi:hypothetical protein D3C76_1078350 [compost metagenome]